MHQLVLIFFYLRIYKSRYNYIYGVTNVPYLDFSAGIFLGSLKPYLLDSYLGFFGKNLIEGTGGDTSTEDYILLVALGVSTLIGVFASQLAGETWEAIQKEVEDVKLSKLEEGVEKDDDITRSFLGIDLPQFFIGMQLALKEAEERIQQTVDTEFEAKVWNYTKPELIPNELNPAKAINSPESVGKYKGFEVTKALCDGLVLSPVLFSTYWEYSDPTFNEEEKLKEISEKRSSTTKESTNSPMSITSKSNGVTRTETTDAEHDTVVSNEKIDVYLFETLGKTRAYVETNLDNVNGKI